MRLLNYLAIGVSILASANAVEVDMMKDADLTEVPLKKDSSDGKAGRLRILRTSDAVINLDASSKMDNDEDEFMDVDHMIDITKDSEETSANEEKNSKEPTVLLTSTVDTESFERSSTPSSTTETQYMASSEVPETETPDPEKEPPRLSSSTEVVEARELKKSLAKSRSLSESQDMEHSIASPNDVAVELKYLDSDPMEHYTIPKTSWKTSVSSASQESDYLSSSEATTKTPKSTLYPTSQSTTRAVKIISEIPESTEVTTVSNVISKAASPAPELLTASATVKTSGGTKPRKQKIKETMKITKATQKPTVQELPTSDSRSTTIEPPEPRITIPIPTDKDDWTIVSSTLQTDPNENKDYTLVRYYVKLTESPPLKIKKKVPKNGDAKETKSPMQVNATGVTLNADSAATEQIFVPIRKDNFKKLQENLGGESAVTIPVADVFRETFAPSEHTTPSSMDGENSVDPFEMANTTSRTSSTRKPSKPEAVVSDKLILPAMKYSIRPSSAKEIVLINETATVEAEDASGDRHSNSSLPDILLSHDSPSSSEIIKNEVFSGDSDKSIEKSPRFSKSRLGSTPSSELDNVDKHTPLPQRLHSSDIPTQGVTQAHGVVVSHTPKTPLPLGSENQKSSEMQSIKGDLVPVRPSVFPKRLQELPDVSGTYLEKATVTDESKNGKLMKKVEGSSEASLQVYDEIKGLDLIDGDVKAIWNSTPASKEVLLTKKHHKLHSFALKPQAELQAATGTKSPYTLSKNYNEILEEQRAKLSAALQEILDSFVRNASLPSPLHAKPTIPPSPPLATSEVPPLHRYTTMKVVTVKPIPLSGSTRKRKVDESIISVKEGKHGAGELWWTPRPSFHGKTMGSPHAYTNRHPQNYRSKFRAASSSISNSGYAKSLRTDVNTIQYTPLATATAVGQSTYNRTLSEYKLTTHLPVRVKDAHPKTAMSVRIPENHLQILQGELEMLTASTSASVEPQTLATPADRAMFGKPKRIVHTRNNNVNNLFLPTLVNTPNKRTIKKLMKTRKASNKRKPTGITNAPLETVTYVEDQAIEKAVTDALVESSTKEDTNAISEIVKRERGDTSNLAVLEAPPSATLPKRSSAVPAIKTSRSGDIHADGEISETQMKSMVDSDMDELEIALKEIAQMSEHQGTVTSFFGDYKDTPQSAESGIAKSRLRKQPNIRADKNAKAQVQAVDLKPEKGTISTSLKLIAPPPPLDSEVVRTPGMQSIVEKQADALRQNSSKVVVPKQLCVDIKCDFEKGDLCGFDPAPLSMIMKEKRKSRARRAIVDSSYFELRRWSIWVGNYSKTNKRVDQAPVFSPMNRRFAASLLSGQQMATMSIRVMTMEPITVTFDGWEATQQMLMRACCDSKCPLTTYFDVLSTDRSWQQYSMNCPVNTHTITFECLNFGNRRGACGIDNFNLQSQSCTNKPMST